MKVGEEIAVFDQQRRKESDERDPTYFSYYAQFVHQQNMLQDSIRTSLYQTAILSNSNALFLGKTIMDLGAGSGILSYFAVRAGAEKVYAVEASGMADKIQKLMDHTDLSNCWLKGKLTVIKSKIEEVDHCDKVDTLISEPIGVLLVHERMIESYIVARDRFLKPGGAMVPSMGTIYVAPFSDANLWSQTMAKVRFWEQQDFYGIDFSPLAKDAKDEVFGQPIVGGFDARILISPAHAQTVIVDFRTVTKEEIQDIIIPFTWVAQYTGLVHGIAAWFDINLGGYILSTAPHAEKTHWHQVRMMLKEPLAVNAFETIRGWFRMVANPMRSYDITAEIVTGQTALSDPKAPMQFDNRLNTEGYTRRFARWALHEQTYYFDQPPPDHVAKPEYAGLYEPETSNNAPLTGFFE
ncbi:S-adenosyl-L-methionine-dependent methyltransferase [Globomyces pollinis-pini]|nr:S-adenosyl-L-methionine-dependent methyltransferase [Globomyces pollinis-pini]